MRLVLDPNVFVSAAVADGVSRRLVALWREERRYDLVVCPMLLDELHEVLQRDRFRTWITLDEVDALIRLLRSEASLLPDPHEVPPVSRDPDDDYLVALARREKADAIVSGDHDLTALELDDLPILTPAHAVARLSETG